MRKWLVKNKKYDYKNMVKKYGISQIICKLLVNRNILEDDLINSFINPDLDSLHNPRDMKDIIKASEIIKNKINNKSKIRIIGDYDI